jgi:hypothetical protein
VKCVSLEVLKADRQKGLCVFLKAVAAPLAWSVRGLESEAVAGRQHEREAVARSTPALLYCAPARAPTNSWVRIS